MPISDQRRPPLPAGLSIAQRDFCLELRRLVAAAGLSCRALEEDTSTGRSDSEAACFYSKSQWGRWLNGLAPPPRRAVRKLSERLVKDAIPAEHLVDLWDAAFAPYGHEESVNAERPAGQLRPRQLPISAQRFIGRTAELETLTALAGQVASSDGPVVVVIEGTAGVGKSTLACHLARGVSDQFPDGQLYVNLRGFDHAMDPMPASEVLPGFLDALGVPVTTYRPGVEDQAALYRSVLAGKRVLIVIDDARDAEQVRNLLPGERGCLVLVTSRNRLCGLVAQGARSLRLHPLTGAEACELLSSRLGAGRVHYEQAAADELISLCAGLPLALGVAAAHIAANPHFPIGVLTEELRGRGLDALETGDPATTIRSVLAQSYQYLKPEAATMYRLLGVHPGPDISAAAAASLAGVSSTEARRTLDELARAHLADEHRPGRFTFHALLRAYAAELSEAKDDEGVRRAAMHRVLDHYLHTAVAAAVRFTPYRPRLELGPVLPGVVPGELTDRNQAVTWFRAEAPVLLALIRFAFAEGFDSCAWQLPWVVAYFFVRRGRWQEMLATQQIAVAAAMRLGDARALSQAHYYLGFAYALMGDYKASEPQVRQALAEAREIGDRRHEAQVLSALADIVCEQGRPEEALELLLDGLRIVKAGHRWAQGQLEIGAGEIYARLGRYEVALTHCQRGLGLHRESGNPTGAAVALRIMGLIHFKVGDLVQARSCYEQAAAEHRDLEEPYWEAMALDGLGDALAAAGDLPTARAAWERAVVLLDRFGHPSLDPVRAKLADHSNR